MSSTPPDPEATGRDTVPDQSSILLETQIEDLERDLRTVRRKAGESEPPAKLAV